MDKGGPCFLYSLQQKRKDHKIFIEKRRKEIRKHNLTKLGPLKQQPIKKRKTRPLKTKDKETILDMIQNDMAKKGCKRATAIKTVAATFGTSTKMVRSIVKEKAVTDTVVGGPYPKIRQTCFEKLTIEQKDKLRSLVHDEMRKCLEKEENARYPTVKSIHTAFHNYSNESSAIPKWSLSTTFKVLQHLGFMYLQNHNIHYGLLVDNDYTVARRKYVTKQLIELEKKGYYLVFVDESYINLQHRPKKMWHDTTVHTAKEAKERGLTPGTLRPPGRGERLIMIGGGGREGWAELDIIQRSEGEGNDLNYKKNMDGAAFEKFCHRLGENITKDHEKVAVVLDNASYHNEYREDIPRHNWSIKRFRAFCELNKLDVPVIHGRRGRPILADYKEAVRKYILEGDLVYKIDVIFKSYGIIVIRLPPYHPGNIHKLYIHAQKFV